MQPYDALPPALGISFTLDRAREHGVPYGRLRRRDTVAPSRSLRLLRSAEPTLLDRVVPLTELSTQTAASHVTAAQLWGIFLPAVADADGRIHLTRPPDDNRPRRPGVRGHRASLAEHDVVRMFGAAVTSPARTWVDLAETLRLEDLVAAGDSLLRRFDAPWRSAELSAPDPLSNAEAIAEVISRRAGCRGVRRAREALPLLRAGADSAPESKLRLAIIQAGLPEPEVNRWILDASGRMVSRPDLQYPGLRIALEYEGAHHLLDPVQWNRDIDRDDRLRAMGWTVLRFSKEHLRPERLPLTIAKIRRAIAAAERSSGQK
jgi:hypothetical protein